MEAKDIIVFGNLELGYIAHFAQNYISSRLCFHKPRFPLHFQNVLNVPYTFIRGHHPLIEQYFNISAAFNNSGNIRLIDNLLNLKTISL